MLLNKGSSQTKSINKHLTIHIFDNESFLLLNTVKAFYEFYVIKQRKQSNQINKQTSNIGSSQAKYPHIFDNPRKFYVIKQRKQSNQINKKTSHYPHIR